MTIHVLVQAVIDQRQAKAAADDLADSFDGTGARAAEKFGGEFDKGMAEASPRIQRSFHGIENAIDKVTERKTEYDKAMESGSEERQERAANRLAAAQRALADAYRASAGSIKSFSEASDRDMERSARNRMAMANAHRKQIEDDAEAAARAAERLASSAVSITDQLADMGRTAGMAFRGTAMLGAPIILMDIAGAAGALAGVLGPMTGALGAAAVGIGTFKMATAGFGDAISNMGDTEKFVESLKTLSPQAQQAALSLRSLMPVLQELQRATQDAFFAGSGPQLQTFLGQMLPMVRETTTGVASAFNEMFTSITNQMMSSGTFASIESFARNTVNAFHELAPAAAPFVSALSDIASVGSGFLPLLAGQISELAQEFSTWIGEAKSDGSLAEWMARGVNAAENLLSVLDDVAKMFDALGDRGTTAIDKIVNGIELLTSTVRVLSGDLSGLGDMMPAIGEALLEPFNKITDVINMASGSINYMIRGLNSVAGTSIPEIPTMNPISDVARGRDVFGGPIWMDHGPNPGETGPGAISPTRGENRTSRPGGTRTDFPTPFGMPDAGNGIGIGNRISGTGTWQSPFAPGQGGINGSSGRSGRRGPSGQDWSAPASEWSLDNVPIGSFPGVPGPPGIPNVPTTPQGPVDPQAMWDAQSRSESARFRVEETRQRYLELAHDNTTSETDLLKAKHDVSESERDYISAQMKAAEVARGKFKDLSSGMDQIGAALDNDFGLSEGLPGLAKNLTMFLANLAAAPALGELQRTANAAEAQGQPAGGFGLLGINGARNMMSGLTPLFGQTPSAGSGSTLGGPTGVQSAYGTTSAASTYPGGAYPGDAALLANVPKGIGQYDNVTKDLSRGLVDCASGVEDLVNIMDGKSTVGGSLWTGNASTVLPQMGFLPGMGGPGDFRVGYRNGGPGGGHMQATLPGGTNVNFGSTPAVQSGGVAPNQGAFDPSFTDHYYRPAGGNYGGAGASVPTGGGGPAFSSGDITNPALTNPPAPAGFAGIGDGRGQGGYIGQGANAYDANRPTGGGNFNPNIIIDTSTSSVAPPMAATSGTGSGILGFTGGGMLDVSGQRTLDMGTGLTKAPGDVGYSLPPLSPITPNIGPGPLQVGPPGVPSTGGIPGQVGPFPTPAGIGPAPIGGGNGSASPTGVPPAPQAGVGTGATQIGGVTPGVAMGGTGGIGVSGGLMDAAMMAAGGLDLLAPGAGQAAQTGIKLANRAIQYGSQLAGIGVSGLMETFLPTGGSELASGGWLPRIIGGIAGAKPALPNLAGGKPGQPGADQPPLTPDQVQQQGMTAPPGQGPNLSVTVNNNGATPDQNGSAVAYHAEQMYQAPAMAGA